ncbi:MAG TPA: biotin/lipoyl-containing protein, partial [Bacteroidales bacterium]
MATAVIMPKQGQSVETCIITKWFRNIGESVSVGDILFSYETDKASFDLESPVEGTLLDIFFGDGDEVPVLVNVAVIGKSGEETQSFNQGHSLAKAEAEPEAEVETKADNTLQLSTDSKIRISPRAKKMAHEKGVNYN